MLTQLIHVFECKSERKRLTRIPLGNNPWLIGAALTSLAMILAVIYVPFLQPVFRTIALSGSQLLTVLGISLLGPLLSGLFHRDGAPRAFGSAERRRQGKPQTLNVSWCDPEMTLNPR